MTCPDPILLQALFDDELDAANAAAVEAHLRTCPDCTEALARLNALHAITVDPALRHDAPADLYARLDAALPAGDRANPWPARHGWARGGAGAAIAAGLAQIMTAAR